jgi:hypothetical protein
MDLHSRCCLPPLDGARRRRDRWGQRGPNRHAGRIWTTAGNGSARPGVEDEHRRALLHHERRSCCCHTLKPQHLGVPLSTIDLFASREVLEPMLAEARSGSRTAEREETKPIGHIVKPLNGGASTHRWVRTPLRGLTMALLTGCRCFTGLARCREERERRRESGARVLEKGSKLVLLDRESRTAVGCKRTATNERATVQPVCQAIFLAQDQTQPGV